MIGSNTLPPPQLESTGHSGWQASLPGASAQGSVSEEGDGAGPTHPLLIVFSERTKKRWTFLEKTHYEKFTFDSK